MPQELKAMITYTGFFDMQVCVPKSWSDEEVTKYANTTSPSGTRNGWTIRKQGSEYLSGCDERVQCAENENNCHIMLDA